MVFHYIWIVLVLFVSFPSSGAITDTVSLDVLIEKSKSTHPEHTMNQLKLSSLEAMQEETLTPPNPMVFYEQMNTTGMSAMKEETWSIRQRLPFPWKTYLSFEIIKKEIAAAKAEWLQSEKNRISQLKLDFFRWLSLQNQFELKKEQESLLSQLIAVQQTRYISQKISQVELVALQIERGNLLNEMSQIEGELGRQKTKVQMLVGPDVNLASVAPKKEKLPLRDLRKITATELLKQLEANSAEVAAASAMSDRSALLVRQSKIRLIPDLEFMFSQTKESPSNEKKGWQVGFEIPLWLAGEQRALIRKEQAEAASAQYRLTEVKRKLILEAEALQNEQMQIRHQLEIMENGLLQWSRQNVRSARTAYQTGKLEYANFLALMQTAYQTLFNYEDLKVRALENQEQLDLIIGG